MFKIVETDNFGRDYPNESFIDLPAMKLRHAENVASVINAGFGATHPRYWKVVPADYELDQSQP